MADQAIVRRWLTQFGRLSGIRIEPAEASEYLDAFCPMLARRFDDNAFTAASLEHIAAECKYLPTYGELVPLLSGWLRQHRETERLLALPEPAAEAREPYKLPPAPDWCFQKQTRHFSDKPEFNRELKEHERPRLPIRSVEQQIAELRRMMAEEASLPMAAE